MGIPSLRLGDNSGGVTAPHNFKFIGGSGGTSLVDLDMWE